MHGWLAVPGAADEGIAAAAADDTGRGLMEGLWSLVLLIRALLPQLLLRLLMSYVEGAWRAFGHWCCL